MGVDDALSLGTFRQTRINNPLMLRDRGVEILYVLLNAHLITHIQRCD